MISEGPFLPASASRPWSPALHLSDAARRARRHNLSKSRLRSDWEGLVIKLLIWQACFGGGARPSQRALARQLGVYAAREKLADGLEDADRESGLAGFPI